MCSEAPPTLGTSAPPCTLQAPPPSAHTPASGVGFSPAQLLVLKSQIVVYKSIKGSKPVPQAELGRIQPPPLLPALPPAAAAPPQPAMAPPPQPAMAPQPVAVQPPLPQLPRAVPSPAKAAVAAAVAPPVTSVAALGAFAAAAQPVMPGMQPGMAFPGAAAAGMPSAMGMASSALAAAQQQQQRAAVAAQQAGGGSAAAQQRPQSVRNSGQGPVFTLAAAPKGGVYQPPAPQSGFLRPQQLRYDVSGLVQVEYQRLLSKATAARRAEIEATRAGADTAAPGFRYRSHQVRRVWGGAAGCLCSPQGLRIHPPTHLTSRPACLAVLQRNRCPSAVRRWRGCA